MSNLLPVPHTTLPKRQRSATAIALAAEPSARVWLKVKEAAAHINVSEKTVRRRIDEGTLRAVRFGGKSLRIELADLEGLGTPAHPGSP